MEHIVKDESRVCQIPPTLIEASGRWYQKPWTSIMSLSIQTKAASLQLIIATLLLLIGVISSYVTDVMNIVYFVREDVWGFYNYYFGPTGLKLLTFFLATVLPLVIGVVALILVYGFWMNNKISWRMAYSVNTIGLLTVVPSVVVLNEVFLAYSNPEFFLRERGFDFYAQIMFDTNIWSILFWLVPLLIILSFTMTIYLGFGSGPRSMTSVQDSKSDELQEPEVYA